MQQDASGEILFESISALQNEVFPVHAEKIVRENAAHTMLVGDKETNTMEMTEYFQEEEHSGKGKVWIIALVIAIIAIAVLFIRFYNEGFNIESTSNQQSIDIR